mmetsp:Transcript_25162/g.44734  ORF Transcript_25162/g.44734 Transcript_25162/m.44734 type:complete len:311 (+) Transcript_25162:253-1185(+)|eukprot:CAMPEP_0197526278 /NCGR_PEP_ID=MMETSP1318-20131121/17100_1 /TAXON_ID=552666 /ORGANISM="Partenskyella glossopodia, Strain RCC365" /LENGTH=310 /DNA_ID=CAMNT_0043080375 /DNA_START=253 /DNA_END=1185 /DNA_ORIENTATION=+
MGCGVSRDDTVDPSTKNITVRSKLRRGIQSSDLDLLNAALDEQEDLAAEKIEGIDQTPIEFAASLGRASAVKALFKRSASTATIGNATLLTVTIEGRASDPPQFPGQDKEIHLSHDSDVRDTVEVLLDSGCDVNQVDEGLTPLQRAVFHGLPETVELLIERKADIHIVNHKGQNLIHQFAHGRAAHEVLYCEIFRTLVAAGVDALAVDVDGNTYIDSLLKAEDEERIYIPPSRRGSSLRPSAIALHTSFNPAAAHNVHNKHTNSVLQSSTSSAKSGSSAAALAALRERQTSEVFRPPIKGTTLEALREKS